jgi:RNA polymerase sigma-70 factor, ECF subfamily
VSVQEDQADVDRVLAGELSAFEGIVRRWQKPLVNLAYRFCGDRGRAEEMGQEAFLRVYRSLPQWRREGAFSTWLFALATNFYRNELRHIPVHTWPLESVAELCDPNDPEDVYGGVLRDRAVRTALHSLPEKYRTSVLLFYFHDMDVGCAAKSLGLPEGTVKARLARGRKMLRSKLARVVEKPVLRVSNKEAL